MSLKTINEFYEENPIMIHKVGTTIFNWYGYHLPTQVTENIRHPVILDLFNTIYSDSGSSRLGQSLDFVLQGIKDIIFAGNDLLIYSPANSHGAAATMHAFYFKAKNTKIEETENHVLISCNYDLHMSAGVITSGGGENSIRMHPRLNDTSADKQLRRILKRNATESDRRQSFGQRRNLWTCTSEEYEVIRRWVKTHRIPEIVEHLLETSSRVDDVVNMSIAIKKNTPILERVENSTINLGGGVPWLSIKNNAQLYMTNAINCANILSADKSYDILDSSKAKTLCVGISNLGGDYEVIHALSSHESAQELSTRIRGVLDLETGNELNLSNLLPENIFDSFYEESLDRYSLVTLSPLLEDFTLIRLGDANLNRPGQNLLELSKLDGCHVTFELTTPIELSKDGAKLLLPDGKYICALKEKKDVLQVIALLYSELAEISAKSRNTRLKPTGDNIVSGIKTTTTRRILDVGPRSDFDISGSKRRRITSFEE